MKQLKSKTNGKYFKNIPKTVGDKRDQIIELTRDKYIETTKRSELIREQRELKKKIYNKSKYINKIDEKIMQLIKRL